MNAGTLASRAAFSSSVDAFSRIAATAAASSPSVSLRSSRREELIAVWTGETISPVSIPRFWVTALPISSPRFRADSSAFFSCSSISFFEAHFFRSAAIAASSAATSAMALFFKSWISFSMPSIVYVERIRSASAALAAVAADCSIMSLNCLRASFSDSILAILASVAFARSLIAWPSATNAFAASSLAPLPCA